MNEIEKAIAVIEYALEETVDGAEDALVKTESLKTALAALREKAERKKGCEYCDFSMGTVGANFEGEDEFFLMETEDGYFICSDGKATFRESKITCCPQCGRKLVQK
jgi:Zn finger protein HypA/HybF involved in hydrogenase expression